MTEPRRNVIQIRVSDEEKAKITELAQAHSQKMSDWVRTRSLAPVTGPPQQPERIGAALVAMTGRGPADAGEGKQYKCPAGHDYTSEAPGARCFCNRPVVEA